MTTFQFEVMDVRHWDEILTGTVESCFDGEQMETEPDAVLAGALHSAYPVQLAGWEHIPMHALAIDTRAERSPITNSEREW